MDVLFNFPNGIAFTVDMQAVPKKGDLISLVRVTANEFRNLDEFKKYEEYEYSNFSWYVSKVIWTPAGGNLSYVNVMLQRVAQQ